MIPLWLGIFGTPQLRFHRFIAPFSSYQLDLFTNRFFYATLFLLDILTTSCLLFSWKIVFLLASLNVLAARVSNKSFKRRSFQHKKFSTKASDTQVPKKGTCFIGSWNCHLPSCCCTWLFRKSGGWWNQNHYRRNLLEEELNLEVTQKNIGRLQEMWCKPSKHV